MYDAIQVIKGKGPHIIEFKSDPTPIDAEEITYRATIQVPYNCDLELFPTKKKKEPRQRFRPRMK